MKREYFILGCNFTIINNTSLTRMYVMTIAMTPNTSNMIDRTKMKKKQVVNVFIMVEKASIEGDSIVLNLSYVWYRDSSI